MPFVPIVLSLIVLGAHFFRSGRFAGVALALGLLGLLGVRRPWAARAVQTALLLGSLEWVRTLVGIARRRAERGEPYLRLVAILGVVAAVTAASAWVFQSARLKRRYQL